jgi:hypothetical protein
MEKKTPMGIYLPLEASHDHLLVTPPSHFAPQKDKGFVGMFFKRGKVYARNNRVTNSVKGKNSNNISILEFPYFADSCLKSAPVAKIGQPMTS